MLLKKMQQYWMSILKDKKIFMGNYYIDEVEAVFGQDGPYDLNFIRVNAQERFYAKLKGVEIGRASCRERV